MSLSENEFKGFSIPLILKSIPSSTVKIPPIVKRQREDLIRFLCELPDATLHEILTQLRAAKARKKGENVLKPEYHQEEAYAQKVQAAIEGPLFCSGGIKVWKECIRKYRDATSNKRLQLFICAVCGRRLEKQNVHTVLPPIDIPNRHLLRPPDPLPEMGLWQGLLLCRAAFTKEGNVSVCSECYRELSRGKLPGYSLANDMWIGDMPTSARLRLV
jgi:hypothetical protein